MKNINKIDFAIDKRVKVRNNSDNKNDLVNR